MGEGGREPGPDSAATGAVTQMHLQWSLSSEDRLTPNRPFIGGYNEVINKRIATRRRRALLNGRI